MVSRVPRLVSEGFHHLLIQKEEPSSGGAFEIRIPRMQASESIPVESPKSVYKVGAPVGKSVTRVGISAAAPNEFVADDAEVFDRWSQAVASAYGLISAANSYFWKDDADLCAYWIVPVLVVPRGTLWVADYDAKGILQGIPKIADEVEIYLDHSSWQKGQTFSYTISHLHFVTPEGLLKLVDRIVTNMHFRNGFFLPINLTGETLSTVLLMFGSFAAEWISKIFEIVKLPIRYAWMVVVVSGLLLFLPDVHWRGFTS